MFTDLQQQADLFALSCELQNAHSALMKAATAQQLSESDSRALIKGAELWAVADWSSRNYKSRRIEDAVAGTTIRPHFYNGLISLLEPGFSEELVAVSTRDKVYRALASGGTNYDLFYDEATTALNLLQHMSSALLQESESYLEKED